jgi:tRNA1Val (adenine37-N6)-methyltransferase
MAKRSIEVNGLSGRVDVIQGDIRDIGRLFNRGCAGAVVVNPPYIKINGGLLNDDATKTIAKHETMCNLSDVVKAAAYLTRPGSGFFMVHRPQRLTDIFCIMRECEIEPKYLRAVHPRYGAKPSLVLIEGKKNANPGLVFLEPLYIYDAAGDYITQDRLQQISVR